MVSDKKIFKVFPISVYVKSCDPSAWANSDPTAMNQKILVEATR